MTEEQDEGWDDEPPPPRRRWRPWWVAAALVAVVGVVAAVALLVGPAEQEPGEYADEVAAALSAGGDDRFRSVFCESTEERKDGVDVFALLRPFTATVEKVVEEDDANAMALLDVGIPKDRVYVSLARAPGWCVDEMFLCTTEPKFTTDPPRLPCDGLLGLD